MKPFLLFLALLPGLVFAQTRPNIVIMLMDDLGWNDVGANTFPSTANPGPPPASVSTASTLPAPNPAWDAATSTSLTPRIDSLGTDGARMTRFLSTSPVCSPTRASLMTGSYPRRVRIETVVGPYPDDKANFGINSTEVTLPERLREAGYLTAMSGKWHLGHKTDFLPTRHGFQRYFGILYSNDMWTENPYSSVNWGDLRLMRDETPLASYTTGTAHSIIGRIDTDFEQSILLEAMTEEALDAIDDAVDADQPFFLYFAPHTPHMPMHPHPDFLSAAGQTQTVARYYDVIDEIDHRVGQILDKLAARGVAGDTVVIFTSDNGPWHSRNSPGNLEQGAGSAYPFRGSKNESWEGGHRVPFFVRWPGNVPAGTVLGQHGTTMDLYTTVLSLTGVEAPTDRTVDGVNLADIWTGASSAEARTHFFYYDATDTTPRGVLDLSSAEKWKLLDINKNNNFKLYELGAAFTGDFQESSDVSGSNSGVKSGLQSVLSSWNNSMSLRERGWAQSNSIDLETDEVHVPETGTATVRLRLAASDTRTVTVSRFSGDADLDVVGGHTLSFTPSNWNQWQTVTFSFPGDADQESSGATFRAASPGLHVREIYVFEEDTLQISPPTVGRVWPKGNRVAVDVGGTLLLEAAASDDGAPTALATTWEQISGPGTTEFEDGNALRTRAAFPAAGTYVLRFTADDGQSADSFDLQVRVGQTPASTNGLAVHERFNGEANGAFSGSGFSWEEGRVDGALGFDGGSQTWMDTGAVAALESGGLTVAAWVRPTTGAATTNRVVAQQLDGGGPGRTWLSLTSAGELYTFAGGDALSGGSLPLNAWTHVAVTAGGGTVRLWVAGVEVADRPAAIENNTAGFRFGNHKNPDLAQQWIGLLDDARVYTRPLSAAELQAVMGHANATPVVDAAAGQYGKTGAGYPTGGAASDDGNPGPLTVSWETVDAPPAAAFQNASDPATTVAFPAAGEYALRLRADDGHSLAETVRVWRVIKDDDNDGMDDDWETAAGVSQPDVDDDEDGVDNIDEFRTGTDPQSAASRLAVSGVDLLPDGRVRVTWNSNQNQPAPWTVAYDVYVREALDAGDWTRLASGLLPDGASTVFEWTPANVDRLFLKIEAE